VTGSRVMDPSGPIRADVASIAQKSRPVQDTPDTPDNADKKVRKKWKLDQIDWTPRMETSPQHSALPRLAKPKSAILSRRGFSEGGRRGI